MPGRTVVTARLPSNRDRCGVLEVIAADGAVLMSAPVAGRASDEAAARGGNPTRSPRLPYGDTPLGEYRIAREPAPDGSLLLEPREGEAALADANGRYRFLVQGGETVRGALVATSGALRLRDRDLARLIRLVRKHAIAILQVVALDGAGGAAIVTRARAIAEDPPQLVPSRRKILHAGASALAAVAVLGRVRFAWAGDGGGATEYGGGDDGGVVDGGGGEEIERVVPPAVVEDTWGSDTEVDDQIVMPAAQVEVLQEVVPDAPAAIDTLADDVEDIQDYLEEAKAPEVLGQPVPPAQGQGVGWWNEVSPEFKTKVEAIAQRFDVPPDALMAVMSFETGGTFSPTAENAQSGATGLIQFMPETAAELLGTKDQDAAMEKLRGMTAVEQLDLVEKHLEKHHGDKVTDANDLYMTILYPKAVDWEDQETVFDRDAATARQRAQYQQNKALDKDGDGKVTKDEAAAVVRSRLQRQENATAVARIRAEVEADNDQTAAVTQAPTVSTTIVQPGPDFLVPVEPPPRAEPAPAADGKSALDRLRDKLGDEWNALMGLSNDKKKDR